MASLQVRIDRKTNTATFSGPGTFAAKDTIKSLGKAFWNGAQKCWTVQNLTLSEQELAIRFGDITIISEDIQITGDVTELTESLRASPSPDLGGGESNPEYAVPGVQGVSVSQFISDVNLLLGECFAGGVVIFGVVSSIKRHQGRVFLSLADADAPDQSIDCVIWGNEERVCRELTQAGHTLEKDLQVMFRVKVGLNQKNARVSLTIVGVVAEYTTLKLQALREATNKRLMQEGLFTRNKELSIPELPVRIGVITSGGGTVINDFRAALDVARFGFHLFWLPTAVQGAGAKEEIVRGLQQLGSFETLDLIVLFRGGGGAAELSVFNDYEVARAICLCPIPVLSAIGHEADHSSAQDVSFRAFGVPKDIGRFLADIVADHRERFERSLTTVRDAVTLLLGQRHERLALLSAFVWTSGIRIAENRGEVLRTVSQTLPRMGLFVVRRIKEQLEVQTRSVAVLSRRSIDIASEQVRERGGRALLLVTQQHRLIRERLLSLGALVRRDIRSAIERSFLKLAALETRIGDASPEVQLRRGFALIERASDKQVVIRGAEVSPGELVEIRFSDMKRGATIR